MEMRGAGGDGGVHGNGYTRRSMGGTFQANGARGGQRGDAVGCREASEGESGKYAASHRVHQRMHRTPTRELLSLIHRGPRVTGSDAAPICRDSKRGPPRPGRRSPRLGTRREKNANTKPWAHQGVSRQAGHCRCPPLTVGCQWRWALVHPARVTRRIPPTVARHVPPAAASETTIEGAAVHAAHPTTAPPGPGH